MPRTRMPQAITLQPTPPRSRRRDVPDEIVATLTANDLETQLKVARWTALSNGALSPLQEALVDHDVFRCKYCTSGQIGLAAGLIAEGNANNVDEIRDL
jgi:xanthine dehydrogenase YagT iron-sulfur-binding subunit